MSLEDKQTHADSEGSARRRNTSPSGPHRHLWLTAITLMLAAAILGRWATGAYGPIRADWGPTATPWLGGTEAAGRRTGTADARFQTEEVATPDAVAPTNAASELEATPSVTTAYPEAPVAYVAALTAWLYGWLPDSGPYEDADGRGAAELDADALVRLHQLEDAYQADSTEALSAWVAAWRSRVPANTADDVAKLVELTGPASDGHDVVSLSEPESVDTGGSAAPDAIHAEPLTGDEVIPDTELTYRQALGLAYDVVTAATTDGVWPAIEQAPRGEAVRLASDGCTFLLWRDLSQLEARPEWLFDLGVRDFWLGDTDANADSLQSFRDATVIQVTHCRPARIEPTVYLQPVDIRLLHTFVYSEPPLRDPTATPTSVPTMPGYPGYIGPPSQFPTPLTPGSDDALEVNRRLRFLHRVLAGSEDAWPWEAQPAPRMYVLQADAMRAAAVALDRVVLLERTDETWVYSGRSADLSRRY